MTSILMVLPDPNDATSYYRASGPFNALRRSHGVELMTASAVGWSALDGLDMVFLQRPYNNDHRRLAEMCKLWNVPLWVDFDDLLLEVPSDNPAHSVYSAREVQHNIIACMQMASVITVSTKQLKRCIQLKGHCQNQNVIVVENALNDKLLRLAKPMKALKHVNWRGTPTHMRDLAEYTKPILETAEKYRDVSFSWINYHPWFITDGMDPKQAIVIPPLSIGEYFEFMSKTNPQIQIVPLSNSMFNQCKSNIAWIEASLAGAVCIGPDWEEWRRPGMITYQSQEDFGEALEMAIKDFPSIFGFHEMSMEFIRKELLLSKVNLKRAAIADALAGKGPMPDGAPYPEEEPGVELA